MRLEVSSERQRETVEGLEPNTDVHSERTAVENFSSHDNGTASTSAKPSGGVFGVLRALSDDRHGRQLRAILLFTLSRDFKPSEAFVVEMYVTHGFTRETITSEIFPAWTYARVPSLLAVMLLSNYLGCKKTVLLGVLSAVFTVLITLFVTHETSYATVWLLVSQVSVAFSFASHQAFVGMTFATLPLAKHPAAAHGIKAVTLVATSVSSLLGQAVVSEHRVAFAFVLTLATQGWSAYLAGQLAEGEAADASNENSDALITDGDDASENDSLGGSTTVTAIATAPRTAAVYLWCLWSVAFAPPHAFVSGNWQLLFRSHTGKQSHSDFGNGYFLATQQLVALAVTFLVGALAYRGAKQTNKHKNTLPSFVILVGSVFTGAVCVFIAGSRVGETIVRCALVVVVAVFESVSSVCAATVASQAKQVTYVSRSSPSSQGSSDEDETRRDPNAHQHSQNIATRLTFLFALLSVAGYVVELITESVTDTLYLSIRPRFIARSMVLFVATVGLAAALGGERRRQRNLLDDADVLLAAPLLPDGT